MESAEKERVAGTPFPEQTSKEHSELDPPSPFTTTKSELWAFYLYYVGNNGLSGYNLGPTQFQNLLYLAGYDPKQSPFTEPCRSSTGCVLPFLGKTRDINSIVLLSNSLSLVIQVVLLLVIGAWADYGSWRPNITILFTLVAVGVAFAWLGVEDSSKWQISVVLYMMGLITHQATCTFWTAAFPGLTRCLPEVQESERQTREGSKTSEEHAKLESMSRNRISNVSFALSSAGEAIILVMIVGILKAMRAEANSENNTKAYSVMIAFSGGIWLVCALPWFALEKRRPGLTLPPGTSLLTIGFRQTYIAARECFRLKQTVLYLVFYFLMSGVLFTTVTLVFTLQNSVISYSTMEYTLMLILGLVSAATGVYVYWMVQKTFKISTKAMLSFNAFWILVMTVWGLVGIHTDKFGFKKLWEIWAFQVFYGFLVCPWYSYSQTMISEVSPLPQMFLFFAFFSVVGRSSTFIGELIASAIISASGDNNNTPFAFTLAVGIISMVFLYLLDIDKSRVECEQFLKAEANRQAFE